jgi:polysaccharide pyruvyl transferase WcaK-like protein
MDRTKAGDLERDTLMSMQPYRIGISGSYGGLNLGDEAILESIVRQLRASIPAKITVFTRDSEDTLSRHDVNNAVVIHQMTRDEARTEVEKLDLLILGGGGILYDRDVELYLREVALANEAGVPVVVYAISAGPLNEPASRKLIAKHLNHAVAITVRDRQSQKLLEEAGVEKEIATTADPAVLLTPDPLPADALKRESLDVQQRLIGFSVREPGPAATRTWSLSRWNSKRPMCSTAMRWLPGCSTRSGRPCSRASIPRRRCSVSSAISSSASACGCTF